MNRRLTIVLLVAGYLAAIITANLLAYHYGPSITPYTALLLVAFGLITRDRLADVSSWWAQLGLIMAGSLLAYLANPAAARIAVASTIAFACSEGTEAVLYYAMRRQPWLEKANKSGIIGAAIDSFLFLTIAFPGPILWATIFAQWTAKTAGCFVFSWILGKIKVRRTTIA